MTAPQAPDSAPTTASQKGASATAEPAGSSRTSLAAEEVTTRQAAAPADGRVRRPGPPRPTSSRGASDRPGAAKASPGRTRKARLALKRIDPWSVFLFSLIASVFMGIALVVAVAVLFTVLSSLGVITSVNDLVGEVTGAAPLLSMSRLLQISAILAAVNVVLLTLLATLGALLYNACAWFTGGIELTLGERDG